jgi:hypothetical protein
VQQDQAVGAANALTARWAGTLGDGPTVLSGAGVYPLLALLARSAVGAARAELSGVAGHPAGPGFADSPAVRLALGVWSAADLPLTDRWRAEVPGHLRGLLTGDPVADQRALDGWAAARTGGLIPRMPVRMTPAELLVLVSALLVRTEWARPFVRCRYEPTLGTWRGRPVPGLYQQDTDLGRLRVVSTGAGPLTLLGVPGDGEVQVLLVLGGPTGTPRQVLPAAIAALTPAPTGDTGPPGHTGPAGHTGATGETAATGHAGPPGHAGATGGAGSTEGPGVSRHLVTATDDRPELRVWTVPFAVHAEHDLLAEPGVFGLTTAQDSRQGHFPGISPRPLAVSQARQSATATFTDTGFTAAAVTALAMRAGSAPPRDRLRKAVTRVEISPPFGFLALHRPSGLVLAAGWVTEPLAEPS